MTTPQSSTVTAVKSIIDKQLNFAVHGPRGSDTPGRGTRKSFSRCGGSWPPELPSPPRPCDRPSALFGDSTGTTTFPSKRRAYSVASRDDTRAARCDGA